MRAEMRARFTSRTCPQRLVESFTSAARMHRRKLERLTDPNPSNPTHNQEVGKREIREERETVALHGQGGRITPE